MQTFSVNSAARAKIAAIFAAGVMAAASTAQAAVATVVDNGSSQFGDMYGFALDFDRTQGISGSYTPVPASTPYSIDSVTVFRGNDTSTGTVYLGVYTGLSGSTLSGFQGVSNNTVTLGSLATARAPLTFNFSGINVTPETNPGSGGDVRYFAFQTGTTAITNYLGLIEGGATQGTQVPLARIDGDNGQFSDELSGVLAGNTATATLRTDRSPEYIATINAVPEPAALSLLGVAGLAMLRRRRGA